jgi:exodeoxyribonuclease-1
MTIKVNKAPVLLPMSHITPAIAARLGLGGEQLRQNLRLLRDTKKNQGSAFTKHLQTVYRGRTPVMDSNPDTALYGAFVPNSDRSLVQEVQSSSPAELRDRSFVFTDPRLPELLFRYRARNWPDLLTEREQALWRDFCKEQWLQGDHLTISQFNAALADEQASDELTDKQQSALADLARWVAENAKVLGLSAASV